MTIELNKTGCNCGPACACGPACNCKTEAAKCDCGRDCSCGASCDCTVNHPPACHCGG